MERPSTTEELRTELLERTGSGRFTRELEPDPDGRILGRYQLERRIGAGGYGVVWQAWDERLERDVAVKVIAIEGEGRATQRAEREGRVAARLNHPGIVQLYEVGTDDDAVYLVSELVRGRTFAELLSGGALSDRDVARIGITLCDALSHAHAKGVIHRDVKPQNVMVVAEPAAQLCARCHLLQPEINRCVGLLDAPRPDPVNQHAKAVVRCCGPVDALDADHHQPPFGAALSISSIARTE